MSGKLIGIEDEVLITVRYSLRRDDMPLFIKTIEPFISFVDVEKSVEKHKIKRYAIIISVITSAEYSPVKRLYCLARQASYPLSKRQFMRDCEHLTALGFLHHKIKDRQVCYSRFDDKIFDLEVISH